ncbi:MAG: 2-oxo acid dehydrogenase subunit E2 [Gammaproteobacteria bacterium]|nr:2-oxo acid dehydrogenase subunit E2 [Gammaproteobacteria bacterium]
MSQEVRVPDMGDVEEAEVIEVFVQAGQSVSADEPLITLESDKAAMDLPSPFAGVVETVHVKVGDMLAVDALVVTLTDRPDDSEPEPETPEAESAPPSEPVAAEPVEPVASPVPPPVAPEPRRLGTLPHAGPAVRRFARELGVDLEQVSGSGRKGRITYEDVQLYVKAILTRQQEPTAATRPSGPPVDAERFGPTRTEPLTRIQRRSGANLQRNWQLAPHVAQHHKADITELDQRRKELRGQEGFESLTLTACVLQACAQVLKQFPRVNASLSEDGRDLIVREYVHIGFAANTDEGLVVPVIRDADQKSISVLSGEVAVLAERARTQQLTAEDMQGGGFTLSNLGGIGGGHFTPVINLPQVAVLGISRAVQEPVCIEDQVESRLMMPLSLSYDHRVVDGVEGAQFVMALVWLLEHPDELDWGEG